MCGILGSLHGSEFSLSYLGVIIVIVIFIILPSKVVEVLLPTPQQKSISSLPGQAGRLSRS
jgi:hypothetical protein